MLRVALAMAVLLGHLPIAQFQFVNAAAAVQAFYVVSGFYMALVLDGKYKDVDLFYSNWLLRLAPHLFRYDGRCRRRYVGLRRERDVRAFVVHASLL